MGLCLLSVAPATSNHSPRVLVVPLAFLLLQSGLWAQVPARPASAVTEPAVSASPAGCPRVLRRRLRRLPDRLHGEHGIAAPCVSCVPAMDHA